MFHDELEFDLKSKENLELQNKNSLNSRNKFQSNFSNVRKTFLNWSQKVDINCYTKMMDYSGNYFVQFIWLVILLGSTGATFYLIARSLMDYLKYEVTSQIKLIDEIPTKFPTVTFCDNNPFTSIVAQDFLQNISLLYKIQDQSPLVLGTIDP
jgi:hypothetical protein